jgi:glycosyltransferase involved in cell wall biosynthesis
MKVMFTIDSLAQGGTEQSLAELIPHLGRDIEVVVVYFYNAHSLRETFLKLPCKLFYLDIEEKYGFLKAFIKLKEIVLLEKPDVVVGSLYRSLIISRLVCWFARIPMVDTFVNERYGMLRRERFKGVDLSKFHLIWLLDRMTVFIPKKIISNSYSIAESNAFALGVKSSRIKVIYRGRNTDNVEPWKPPHNHGGFTWMAIGRLIPQKGYSDLVVAMKQVISKYPQVRLKIMGEGPLKDELQEKIIKLGLENCISLLGNIPDARDSLYKADAFVLPSISEGFSGALVEALVTGIPLVASDIPMNLEAISPGRLSFIFKAGDADSLAFQMERLMSDYHEACRIAGIARNRAMDYYNIQHVASVYASTLIQVVNGRKS